MSLALIQESAKEARRLAIAGSAMAVGDFRLKKLVAPLEQAGTKAPVFAQVAKAISDLVNGKEAESATHLLNLSTLLNAILYTQGQTGTDGDYRELESLATNFSSTRTTARALKPLVDALTQTGSGRYEIVKEACDHGGFNDLRLIDPAIHALGDTYAELADLVAEKILPACGAGIIPRLRSTLDLKGKKHDARRLKVMHQLDPTGTLELCKTALDDGSPEVKAAAIACLGRHEDCLPLLLEQANSKNKTLRAAALEALVQHDRPEVTKLFGDLIKGKALDILARPLRAIRNRQVLNSLLSEGTRVFELLLKGDQDQAHRYFELLRCFQQRKDAETEEFLLGCFSQCEKIAKLKPPKNSHIDGVELISQLAALLYSIGSPGCLEGMLAKRDLLPPATFGMVLQSALRVWRPGKVYDEFAPLLQERKGRDKVEHLQHTFWAVRCARLGSLQDRGSEPGSTEAQMLKTVDWDPRWLDAAIRADQPVIVCCLATPGHKGAVDYLLKQVEAKPANQPGLIIEGLAHCQYPQVTDIFLDLVSRKTRSARYFDYDLQLLFESARHLSAADLPKLDAFASKLDEKFLDKYLDAVAPLRPSNQSN